MCALFPSKRGAKKHRHETARKHAKHGECAEMHIKHTFIGQKPPEKYIPILLIPKSLESLRDKSMLSEPERAPVRGFLVSHKYTEEPAQPPTRWVKVNGEPLPTLLNTRSEVTFARHSTVVPKIPIQHCVCYLCLCRSAGGRRRTKST